MKWHNSMCFLVLLTIIFSGCVRLSLRDEIFSSQPLWENSKLSDLREANRIKNKAALKQTQEVYLDEAPGLALLVHQVLGRDLKISSNPTARYQLVSSNDENTFHG